MPRLLTDNPIWRKITALDMYEIASGTIGDTTTTGAVAQAATSIPITATTNFTAGDPAFLIGDGGFELISAIGTPNVTQTITNQKIFFPQSTGARFVEAVKTALGRLSKDGLGLSPTKTLTAIEAADRDLPVAYIESATELEVSFGLLEFTGVNLQLITGFADEEIGTGTSSDPYTTGLGKLNQTLRSNICFRATGVRHDGKNIQMDFLNARIQVSGTIQMNRSQEAITPGSLKFTQMIMRQW